MFGEEYKIHYEFPEYFLDYREILDPTIRWTDRVQSSSGDWTGNLFDFFFRIYPKLTKDLKIPFKLEGITRIDDTPVHIALREALANCIVNTDFFISRGIVITKEDNQIILENPGSIRTGKNQMLKGGISDPRNKTLMKMFNLIGIGERAGSGVPDIFSVWEYQGWIVPEIEEQFNPDRTILKLSFIKKQAEKTSRKNKQKKQAEKTSRSSNAAKTIENKQIIIDFLRINKACKAVEIAEEINLSPSRTRAILSELQTDEIVVTEGKSRNLKYLLKENRDKTC